ncbi:MAG: TlyA family RNA methyltransferase [Campylobacterota bacterium]|nr:TlyA family RNA methyltransferase [Campylobacterota bacterium]
MRLDIHLTKHNNIQSRNKANELIKAKKVLIDGKIVTKPSFLVHDSHKIEIDEENFFVSRAAYKLKYFLEEKNIDMSNNDALDIGSSTGGFTQILLENGVKSVTCVDVGSNQLHGSIKDDSRIIIKENTDIREFKSNKTFEVVTCDVSFISILYIIEDINRLSKDKIIILYKPQFEVGKDIKRDSKGMVMDDTAISRCRDEFLDITKKMQWNLITSSKSKLAGKSGNIEELYYFRKEL